MAHRTMLKVQAGMLLSVFLMMRLFWDNTQEKLFPPVLNMAVAG